MESFELVEIQIVGAAALKLHVLDGVPVKYGAAMRPVANISAAVVGLLERR